MRSALFTSPIVQLASSKPSRAADNLFSSLFNYREDTKLR